MAGVQWNMRARQVVLVLVCALSPARGAGQPSYQSLKSLNPPGIAFTLRIPNTHPFREGELIPVEVGFLTPDSGAGRPRQTEYQFAGAILDPVQICGSLQKPCWLMFDMLTFNQMDPMLGLESHLGPFSTDLNLYLPRLGPGRYRAALLVRQLTRVSTGPRSAVYRNADPPQYVVSDTIEFEIVEATLEWVKESIAQSVSILRAVRRPNEEYATRQRAARQLRFLQHPLAWEASLDWLAQDEGELLRGLVETPAPDAVCRLMQSRIASPGQSVSGNYLSRMSYICRRAEIGGPPVGEEALREWQRKSQAFESQLLERSSALLAASLSAKRPEVKADAIEALFQQVQDVADPAWLPAVRMEAVRAFPALQEYRQRQLLGGGWRYLRNSGMIPSLESIVDKQPPNYSSAELWRIALNRLHDLDPEAGRARLLAALRNADPRLDDSSFALLPASVAPPLDSVLQDAMAAAARRNGGGSSAVVMTAVARYATADLLTRLKAVYESRPERCQPELMAYFLRVDPAYAASVFHNHAWDMQTAPPACTLSYFERTAQLFMHPVLEEYMTTYLMHGDVAVKQRAAISLGKWGSKAAEQPLWSALRYFHEYWKERRAELPGFSDSLRFETELRNAVARGRNWLVTEDGLRTIDALCISESCHHETQTDLSAARQPIRLEALVSGDMQFRGAAAQYYGLESLDALQAKLAQFPKGSRFLLSVWGPGKEQTAAQLKQFASPRGLVILEAAQ